MSSRGFCRRWHDVVAAIPSMSNSFAYARSLTSDSSSSGSFAKSVSTNRRGFADAAAASTAKNAACPPGFSVEYM